MRPRTLLRLLLVLSVTMAGMARSASPPPQHVSPAPGENVSLESWPIGPQGALIRPSVEAFVDQLLAKLNLEEKVGQMIQADINSISPQDLLEYRLGSVLAGGNSAPGGNVRASPAEWLALADAFARQAVAGGSAAHVPIPLLFGIDAVHGHARLPGATVFPHNVGLGAAHDPELISRIGRATAEEVSATGIDWTFAPTVAVARDGRWGRAYESYSEDPRLVGAYAAAMVTGLQGALGSADFMAPGHTISSVKHFLGDGGTVDGRDQYNNSAPIEDLIRVHAAGYPPAISAGVLTVMASYNGWNGTKMHANRALLTDVLKGRLGFNGFIIGDWNAQEEIPGCTKFDCAAVILAGVDMVMAPDSWKQFYVTTLRHVRSGDIPESRIDDAVHRILRVKALSGLFDRALPASRPNAGHFEVLGSPAHRAIAREAVRKSLVLLKNDGGVLPLNPKARILVAGDAADDIGRQSGGWTIDWQGARNTNADFPGATSLYAGIKAAVEAAGGTASLSAEGKFVRKPDAAVVIFGEYPYAEMQGDRETLEFSPGDKRDLALLRRLRSRKIPVVAVFLSGRPMWVNPELNAADAFVAAWLPGSEGEGLADVLFRNANGSIHQDFSGKLGFSWPSTAMPVRYLAGDVPSGALFPAGFGLSYAHPEALGTVAENADAAADRRGAEVLFAGGRVIAPWSIYLSDSSAQVRLTTDRQVSPANALSVALDSGHGVAVWSGAGPAAWMITGRAVDLRAAAAHRMALQWRLRIDQPPKSAVLLGVHFTAPAGAASDAFIDVSSDMKAATLGRWTTQQVALSCFADRGADLAQVEAPFVLSTRGSFAVAFSDVKLVQLAHPSACPAADSAAPAN